MSHTPTTQKSHVFGNDSRLPAVMACAVTGVLATLDVLVDGVTDVSLSGHDEIALQE